MKKIFLSILGIMILRSLSFAQVTLLHTFGSDEWGYIRDNVLSFGGTVYEPLDYYFLGVESKNSPYTWRIYNSSFQLVKEITLPSSITNFTNTNGDKPEMDYFTILGKHLINTDEKIEFFIRLSYPFPNPGILSYIINEDGEILYDFGVGYDVMFEISGIHKVGNQLRAMVASSNGEQSFIQIYSLGGNYNSSTMVTYPLPSTSPNPYPNPSRNTITLPYKLEPGKTSQLRVFNMNGQLLETFNIGSEFDKILLNVSNYPKGIYIYTYNNVSKKFVVQ